ncbi:heme-binding protein 2-like [Argiope bruennichi]|uniref:heme-binding protein 2-like n=1 Tax=Argiope bruennichi TaxID=94029 RepID=UPI002495843A|nr:heme-binding protein 2-like [Argiope bruennichi]
MWKVVTVIVFALTLVEGCVYKNDECAPYTVVETHADYEVRSYPALTWATTTETNRLTRVGKYKAFMRLFRYISGKNDREQKINMTVPVRMKATPSGEEIVHEMSFMIPKIFADNPPVPTDKEITINKEGPRMYAVRTFSGYAWRQTTWNEEAEKLKNSVLEDDTIDKTEYYEVGYDAPFDLFDRRNEIWMKKTAGQERNEIA